MDIHPYSSGNLTKCDGALLTESSPIIDYEDVESLGKIISKEDSYENIIKNMHNEDLNNLYLSKDNVVQYANFIAKNNINSNLADKLISGQYSAAMHAPDWETQMSNLRKVLDSGHYDYAKGKSAMAPVIKAYFWTDSNIPVFVLSDNQGNYGKIINKDFKANDKVKILYMDYGVVVSPSRNLDSGKNNLAGP